MVVGIKGLGKLSLGDDTALVQSQKMDEPVFERRESNEQVKRDDVTSLRRDHTMADNTEAKQQQSIPSRQLVLHVMLSLLVSAAVFVVVSWMVLVPQLAQHERRIRDLEAQISQMQEEAEEAQAAESPATPPAPAAVPAVDKK